MRPIHYQTTRILADQHRLHQQEKNPSKLRNSFWIPFKEMEIATFLKKAFPPRTLK